MMFWAAFNIIVIHFCIILIKTLVTGFRPLDWGACFTYQSQAGLQVLPASLSPYPIPCLQPWIWALRYIIQTSWCLSSSPLCGYTLSLSLSHFPYGHFPGLSPWGQWTPLPQSSFPINLPLLSSNLTWIGSFHRLRNNLPIITVILEKNCMCVSAYIAKS